MKIIGLTGQSGAGKSLVSKTLSDLGYTVADSDKIYHELLKNDEELKKELSSNFQDILSADGEIDRKKLSKVVFSDRINKLPILNQITHKYIVSKLLDVCNTCKSEGEKVVFVDAPQLFEAGFDKYCDITIAVTAEENLRLQRIMKRDGIDAESALLRINSQFSEEFFIKNCDYILKNNENIEVLFKNTELMLKELGLK